MRDTRLWHALFGVEKTIVEAVEFDGDAQVLVGRVRPARHCCAALWNLSTALRAVRRG